MAIGTDNLHQFTLALISSPLQTPHVQRQTVCMAPLHRLLHLCSYTDSLIERHWLEKRIPTTLRRASEFTSNEIWRTSTKFLIKEVHVITAYTLTATIAPGAG